VPAIKEVASFGRAKAVGGRPRMTVPPTPFPATGQSEAGVMQAVSEQLARNLDPQRNWATYGPESHPLAKRVYALPDAVDTYAIEFYRDVFPGILEMAHESIRMIGALLHADDPAGFITTGGTEANLLALRLMRNLGGRDAPEVIVPRSRHYSWDLGAELFGLRLRVLEVDERYKPRVDALEGLVTPDTVGLVCSAPEAALGGIDPVQAFDAIAARHGLYLHVDCAVGGFLLPFMRALGRDVPPFDFELSSVRSITVDPHKLGLAARPAGAIVFRDLGDLDAGVDLDRVVIDTLTASGRPGSATAAVWAMIKHLGFEGYTQLVAHQLSLVDELVAGVTAIEGMRLVTPPECNIVAFTTGDDDEMARVSRELWTRGFAVPCNPLPPFSGTHLRVYVHPLKRRESAQLLIDGVRASIEAARRRGAGG
jgi:tyrosine decarboxylase/aspartate 1-decarboxylase